MFKTEAPSRIQGDRTCRDVFFLIVFAAFWVGMLAVAGIGFSQGDPGVLVFGLDYRGNLCGKDNDGGLNLESYDYRYWPNTQEMAALGSIQIMDAKSICLKGCPKPAEADASGAVTSVKWVCDYPDDGHVAGMTMQQWSDASYDYFDQLNDTSKASSKEFKGPCYPVAMKSTSVYWSCQYTDGYAEGFEQYWTSDAVGGAQPTDDTGGAIEDTINAYMSEPYMVMERYVADLMTAWAAVVVCGLVCPVVLSFLFLACMRYFTALFVWLTIILVNLLSIALTIFTFIKAGIIGDDEISSIAGESSKQTLEDAAGVELDAASSNKDALVGMAVVMTITTVLLFLFTLAMISKLSVATKILKVATQAVMATPTVVLYPLSSFVLLFGFVVYWLFAAVYLYSSGEIQKRDCTSTWMTDNMGGDATTVMDAADLPCGYEVVLDANLQYMLAYHFFGLLWTIQFITAFGQCVIAGAIATYYWTRGEGDEASPVLNSIYRTARYHTGSMALGSFIVAVLEFFRSIMVYVENKCKQLTEDNETAGAMVKGCFCCIQCCLACVEWLLKFINRQAYIVIAVDGSSYCTAVSRAVSLMLSNVLTLATVNTVGDCILFLGKVAISFGSALVTYLYLDQDTYSFGEKSISSPLLVVLMAFISSYAVAGAFMSVTEMAVDTVLLSYCIDCDENNGRAVNAPPALAEVLESAAKEQEKTNAASA